MDREDREIIKDIQEGKETAMNELVKKYQKRVYNMVYAMTISYDRAWDISQDVFIKVIRNIHKFRGDSSFWTYLYRIAINTVYDAGRRKKVRNKVANITDLSNEETGQTFEIKDNVRADEDFENKLIRENLKKGFEKLTETQGKVFVLKNNGGLKIREVAKVLNMSEGTVKSHLNRAVEKLRGFLEVQQ